MGMRLFFDTLYRRMYYIFALSIAFPNGFSSWAFGLWALVFAGRKIYDSIDKKHIFFTIEKRNIPCVVLLALSLLGMLSAVVAEDPALVMRKAFGPRFALFLLPLLTLIDDEKVDFDKTLKWFVYGNALFIAYSFITVSCRYWTDSDITLHRDFLRNFTEVCTLIVHRTYSGLNILLSFVALFYLWHKGKADKKDYLFIGVYSLISISFLFLNNSRIITLSFFLLLFYFGFSYMLRNKRRSVVLFVAIGLLAVVAVFLPSRTSAMIGIDRLEESLSQDPRSRIWSSVWEVGMERPILGYGLNNVDAPLLRSYLSHDFLEGASAIYGPHNEYLGEWIQAGLMALVLLVGLLFVIPLCSEREFSRFSMPFVALFAIVFMTESLLDRCNGCLTFAFFVALLCRRHGYDEGRISSVERQAPNFLTILSLLAMIFFLTTFIRAESNPKEEIIRMSLFDGKGVFEVKRNDVTSFIHDSRCKSVCPLAYYQLPDGIEGVFSVECLASSDFDGSTVKIIAEEDCEDGSVIPTESLYDLGRKDVWQRLSVSIRGRRSVNIYFFGDAKLTFDELKGKVFFKNPRMEIDPSSIK